MQNDNLSQDARVLRAAWSAWNSAAQLRAQRRRNKRFTYGDQWIDTTLDEYGRPVTDFERYRSDGTAPITNNVLRQLVKTIVGRFRSQCLGTRKRRQLKRALEQAYEANGLAELDSRALEEFLISGCAVQRVDAAGDGGGSPTVQNVNVNRFFINAITDPLARDCEIVGQLHDLSVADLLQRVAGGQRRKAAQVRRLYAGQDCEGRAADMATLLGADTQSGTAFWQAATPGKCRAIEVWTLESRETVTDGLWRVTKHWRCRWFSPMGDLLHAYDAPPSGGGHPFVVKLYPLTDGEVHGFIEDVIDQQKFLNRLVTLLDHIMASSAKGVLLYPDTALPDGYSWHDMRTIWQHCNGVLPYAPGLGDAKPEQISRNNTDIGAFEMIKLQTDLLQRISGVNGALQGQEVNTSGSVALYRAQTDNASIALTDIFDTFNDFRSRRDAKLLRLAAAQ